MLRGVLPLSLLAAPWLRSAGGQSSDYPLCESGFEHLIGNGGCSNINNTEECGWDGGDCCDCDCVDGLWECGTLGYDCLDPESLCYDGRATTGDDFYDFYDSTDDFYDSTDDFYNDDYYEDYPLCDGSPSLIATGICTDSNNNEDCGWDGGDCCECDCISDTSCGSWGYDCQNPDSACYEGLATGDDFYDSNDDVYSDYPFCEGYLSGIGSGMCTPENNNEECGWDGGDCCECDCETASSYCGSAGYDCHNPASICYEGDGGLNGADDDLTGTTNYASEGDKYSAGLIVGCAVGAVILLVLTWVLFRNGSLDACECCSSSKCAAGARAKKAEPARDAAPLSPPPAYGSSPRRSSALDREYVSAGAPSASNHPPPVPSAYPTSPPPAYDDPPSGTAPTGAPHRPTTAAPPAPTAPPAPESS